MTIVVDASVALKWVFEEDGSATAQCLVEQEALAAPDFLLIECANVLAVKVRRGILPPDLAGEALAAIRATPLRLSATSMHVAAALAIAIDLQQSAYDSLYLAAALSERASLVTADAAFAVAARRHAVYAPYVRLLGEH